jgi:hypothetical protein
MVLLNIWGFDGTDTTYKLNAFICCSHIGNVSNMVNIALQKCIAYPGIPYSGAFDVIYFSA